MRERDDPIPEGEDLYRRIRADQVHGGMVQRGAVDLPATSVNRAKFSRPNDVLRADRPEFTGIATLRGERLPERDTSPNGSVYEVYCRDHPVEGNDAHALVLVGRLEDNRNLKGHKPSNKSLRDRLHEAIARSMRILIAPRAL